MSLRVAVAGAGIGAVYAECFARVAGYDVVALCGATERNARPAAVRLGIPHVYTDYERMLADQAPDVVAVATPNDLHHPMTLAALEAGAHVVCDKPLALDAREARELWEAAERHGARHAIPFWWRALPAVARAGELVSGGALGEPYFAEVRYLNRGWGDPRGPMRWQFDRERAGHGALGNIGSHALAVLRRITGDLVRVSARSAVNVTERRWPDGRVAHPDAEDTVAAVGELANGAPVSFLASSVAHVDGSVLEVAVHLDGGSVAVSAQSSPPAPVRSRLSVMRHGAAAPEKQLVGGISSARDAYVALAEELRDAIREGRPATPGFEEGVRVQETMDALRASAETGGWVSVERGAAPTAVA
jgi:predicted dehydrogenase